MGCRRGPAPRGWEGTKGIAAYSGTRRVWRLLQSQTHEAFRRRLLSFAGESVFTLYTTYESSVAAMYTSVKASEGTERQPLRTRVCHVLLFRSEVISETC